MQNKSRESKLSDSTIKQGSEVAVSNITKGTGSSSLPKMKIDVSRKCHSSGRYSN